MTVQDLFHRLSQSSAFDFFTHHAQCFHMAIDSSRCSKASERLIRAAAASAHDGETRAYFSREAYWEADMRRRFSALGRRLPSDDPSVRADACALFKFLNGKYKTRYDLAHHEVACNMILDAIPQLAASGTLFTIGEKAVTELAGFIPTVLERLRLDKKNRPYSLTTKFLHFLYSHLFAIYDAQARYSLWMWSLFAIGADQPESKQFALPRLLDTSGSGYPAMLSAYRLIWRSVSTEGRREAIKAARSLERLLNVAGATVGPLSVIDLHLWKAAGDPIILGIAKAP